MVTCQQELAITQSWAADHVMGMKVKAEEVEWDKQEKLKEREAE